MPNSLPGMNPYLENHRIWSYLLFDLQEVLNCAYDDAEYDHFLDYQREPEPPLSPDDALWADALLRNAHRR